MAISISDLLQLPILKNIQLLGGKAGLSRVVTWPYIGNSEDFSLEWTRGGELLFLMNTGGREEPDRLDKFLSDCASRNLAGLVLFDPSDNTLLRAEITELADRLALPLLRLPGNIKTTEVMRDIGEMILKEQHERRHLYDIIYEILYGTHLNVAAVERQAAFFGYNLNTAHQACVTRVINFQEVALSLNYTDDDAQAEFKSYLNQVILSAAARYIKNVMAIPKGSYEAVLLIPIEQSQDKSARAKQVEQFCQYMMNTFHGLQLKAGMGSISTAVWDCKKSLKEAEQALQMASATKGSPVITNFEDLGFFRVLYKFPDVSVLDDYVQSQLGPLLQYDQINDGELMKTLQTYYECKLNLNQTAKELFIHRNSLMYRFKKIEELIHKKPDDTAAYQSLFFSILLYRFLSVHNKQ
ncbi:helix-turn-helix domain-containing protein [Paenibacillus sanguinis]|uniref:helix-turn-helix domain-containing protein n=1 Tax=Paenibacillus sanguinis TaxID=225906 RepID=UPI00035E6FC1|nr:PucR family transcriptional regulator ligand-binding domain-containing protein [Paenibacillus sanguinis]